MLTTLRRKMVTLFRQPLFIQLWLIPLWCVLGICKLLIFSVKFKKLADCLGQTMTATPWVPLLSQAQEYRALQIGRAVRLSAKYTPWDSNCFPQAIAARWLLGLYNIPYALYFGLQRDPELADMKAHAWVAAGRIRVTGGFSFNRFTVVGCFVDPHLP
ncbi:MAG: lasso peptide biosynthesis B2 protein [Methylococcaceae bacterium]